VTRRRRILYAIGKHSLLIAVAFVFVAPFVFVILTSLMTDQQALSRSLWPNPFRLANYRDVITQTQLFRWTWNTTLVAGLSSIGVVLSCLPVAYALARLEWRGRQVAMLLVLSTMMLPVQVTIIPLFVIFSQLHWIGSLKPLIVPSFFGDAFSIFLLRQFLLTIPQELTDAARIDGAGEWRVLFRVIVPLAKPAIAAIFIFNFLYNWNDLFSPLLYLGTNPDSYTLSLGLSAFRSQRHVNWELIMAAAVLFTVPVTALFFAAQKVFVEGITVTGVKG
jgi:multiple sugar transport system permease protein